MTEAMVLKQALLLAIDLRYGKVQFEIDCSLLKDNIDKNEAIIYEIVKLLSSQNWVFRVFYSQGGKHCS